MVLVVDRDDDFGVKGSVHTPVIGLQDALVAAVDLGVNDPEDSDVNGLFAGIKIYNEMKAEGKDVEIALVCGDKNVGHKSDEAITKELDEVLEKVSSSAEGYGLDPDFIKRIFNLIHDASVAEQNK